MIPSSTVKKFMNRELKNYDSWKKLSDEQLQRKCDALPVRPPIWAKLKRHQKVCFLIGVETKRFGFWSDTGTGKTLLSIALILYFIRLRHNKRVLVLVPNLINKGEWAREIRKHAPDTPFATLWGSSDEKWSRLERTKGLIVIETYAGMMRMVCQIVKSKKKKDKNKLDLDKRKLKKLMSLIDGLVMDESNLAKSKNKLPFRICRQISNEALIVFALSGTPFGRDPTDLWGQMFIVDRGDTLGETLGLFRAAFFTEKQNHWGGMDYTFDARKMGLLHRTLAHGSIRFVAKESDLPTVIPIKKYIDLPDDAAAYFATAKQALIDAKGNFTETKNAFLRMRQISSGFLGYKDDDMGVSAQFEFTDNPKLELLLSTIESIRPECKILVFHDFVFSGSIICRELDAAGVKHVRLYHKTKDPAALLEQFDKDPSVRVFVLNTAGAYGLNLQAAQYGLFFERPTSVTLWKQMRRRLERQFSEHNHVFMYDFIVRNTMDERIVQFHEEGIALFKGIIEGKTLERLEELHAHGTNAG